MKNYLATVIGNFITDESCNQLVMSVAPLVESPNMKYQFGGGIIMMYFATDIPSPDWLIVSTSFFRSAKDLKALMSLVLAFPLENRK